MEKEENIYCYCIKREGSLKDIQAWNKGESQELKKWIGFGFFNHLFLSKNNIVKLYYNIQEGEKFWEVLQENLTEDLFHELCDNFFELIEKSKIIDSEQELFKIMARCWPALTIFDEISKYPELATPSMLTRLIRVRNSTQAFSYELSKKLNHENLPRNYVMLRGDLFFKPFEEVLKENSLTIKNE